MARKRLFLTGLIMLVLVGFGWTWHLRSDVHDLPATINHRPDFYVTASVETEPVPSKGDAADDPAVWYDSENPELSTLIGTDKAGGGLAVFDLSGKRIQYVPDGRYNNVDIRQGFKLGGKSVALVTAGDREAETVGIFVVNPETRTLVNVEAKPIETVEPYGSCMYQSAITGKFYYIVNSEDGLVEQWELFEDPEQPGKVNAKRVREFETESGPEGCVADDELGYLYIGEELTGIWKYGAEPEAGEDRILVDATIPNGNLTPEVEGLAIYRTDSTHGYLVASSQGSNQFALYRREGNNKYICQFSIRAGNGIDEVTHTDGLDVTSFSMGSKFPNGFLAVQDHLNDDSYWQNFKLVSWNAISAKMKPYLDAKM